MIEKADFQLAKQGVLTKLGQRLGAHGFDPKPSGQSFYRSIAAGMWAFHIAFMPHQHDFDLTADVAVRIDAVENLVNQYDTKVRQVEKAKSMTLGGELGNLSRGRQMRWTVTSFNEIPEVCERVGEAFDSVGLPFLQTHSNIVHVHRTLSSSTCLAPLLGPRAMRAVAAGYLLNEGSNVKALALGLEAKLVEKEDLYLQDFQALCHSVLAMQPS